jgi:hypothetical protein
MAEPGFYNQNANRSYPFRTGTVAQPHGPLTLRRLPHAIVVDCGFVLYGPAGFVDGVHTVYLDRLRRQGDTFYFEFASDAPGLFRTPLVFLRRLGGQDYCLEFADSGDSDNEGFSASSQSSSLPATCEETAWSGFLVTGKMAELELLLPVDGVIERGAGGAVVEPALVQNLAGTYVARVGLANDDRTRVSAPDGCPEVIFPYPTGTVHVYEPCLVGDIIFVPGYNAVIRQEEGSIIFGAAVGAGDGEPCEPAPLFAGEVPPAGSQLLEGGPRCNDVLRSINGSGGRQFELTAGPGVTIVSVPEEHKVVIDVNMAGLVTCFDTVSDVSESC